jgi:uncharacterized protein DUF4350
VRKRPWLLWTAMFLVAFLLGALLWRRSPAAGASALSASPEGWLAARTYLERSGSRVSLLDRPLDKESPHGALVIAFPLQAFPSPEELDALRQRLSSGGSIVFAYSGVEKGFGERSVGEALGLSFEKARGDPPLSPRRWWAFVTQDWLLEPEPAFARSDPVPAAVIRAPDEIPKAPPGAQVLYRTPAGVAAVFAFARGRGRVVALPADALANARLGNAGNADLLESLRVSLPPEVSFDEYHHGLVSPEAVADSGSAPSLDLLLIELLLLYLLCAWTLGRRFGPSWQEPPQIASSTSAFLLGLGALHRKLRHSSNAALRLIDGAQSYDPRVSIPQEIRGAAFDAKEGAFLEIAKVIARQQRRGRID